jgi:hypothetical protein
MIDMCPWINIIYPSYYSFIPMKSKLTIILNIFSIHLIYNNLIVLNYFEIQLFKNYIENDFLNAAFFGSFLSTLYAIYMWFMFKQYHYNEWLDNNKKRHKKSNLNTYLNKNELDSASYYHNSIKLLKNEIVSFKTIKSAEETKELEKKDKQNKFHSNFNYTRKDSVFRKAYSFFNEASIEIKNKIIEKSKIFDLKDKFTETRLNQKIINESFIKKIDWPNEIKFNKLKNLAGNYGFI